MYFVRTSLHCLDPSEKRILMDSAMDKDAKRCSKLDFRGNGQNLHNGQVKISHQPGRPVNTSERPQLQPTNLCLSRFYQDVLFAKRFDGGHLVLHARQHPGMHRQAGVQGSV